MDDYGKVRSLKAGTATVTVRLGDATDVCTITVLENEFGNEVNTIGTSIYSYLYQGGSIASKQGDYLYYFEYHEPNYETDFDGYTNLFVSPISGDAGSYGYTLIGEEIGGSMMVSPVLSVSGRAFDLNVSGDTIYFQKDIKGYNSEGEYVSKNKVYKASITENLRSDYVKEEYVTESYGESMLLIDDKLLFHHSGGVTLSSLNGEVIADISTKENYVFDKYLYFDGENIFFSIIEDIHWFTLGRELCKLNLDNMEIQLIFNLCEFEGIAGDYMYTNIDGELYRSKIDGTEAVKIRNVHTRIIGSDDEWVYFVDTFDGGVLSK